MVQSLPDWDATVSIASPHRTAAPRTCTALRKVHADRHDRGASAEPCTAQRNTPDNQLNGLRCWYEPPCYASGSCLKKSKTHSDRRKPHQPGEQ